MNNLIVYTDGAYSSSRNQGGIGIVFLNNGHKILEYSNKYNRCSNNQMELGAIIIALRIIKKPVNSIIFYSDSMYCIGTITKNWQKNKNKKLWNEFDKQFKRVSKLCSNIEFKHIKGHQINNTEESRWNNYVDKLAVQASKLL